MRLLPVGVFLLCQGTLFVDWGVVAEQQCRLKVNGKSAGSNTNSPAATAINSNQPNPNQPSPSGSAAFPPPTPFNYGTDKIRGVNLGGWFVLEPWITPSIFQNTNNDAVVDEFTFGAMQDFNTALGVLKKHWQTWITEDDFIAISAAGLNHVRIPLGYWSVPLTSADTNGSTSVSPYIPGAWPYLLQALNWARKHNVRVILDIHGAPGSQNGYDNSGQRTSSPQWALNSANVSRTVDTVRFIAKNIGGMVDVVELLNEPGGFLSATFAQVVRQFWLDGYAAVRNEAGSSIKIMIGDAFLGVQSWTNFLTYPSAQGVFMDFHEYQIFSDLELNRTFDQHISFACTHVSTLSTFASSNIWTIIGEWSNAMTDCAKWLNGRGVGARWDATWFPGPNSVYHGSCTNFTGSYSGFSTEYKNSLRKYWEVQVEIGENIQGWVFWTWKAENADEWSYQKGLEAGWIPQDPTNRMYPHICS
ncbi:glycoside hydrolase family 5 protein [Infundibulicybe gibba]|nr:glycoside hydrolase family 5 protein [Infundibulicybe gibba]